MPLQVHPDRLTDDYLSNRSELISPELSAKVGGWVRGCSCMMR